MLPHFRLKVVLLDFLVLFLHLLVPNFTQLLLLRFLLELQVQSVHHFLSKMTGLLYMLLLRLNPDLQMIPCVPVSHSTVSHLFNLIYIICIYSLPR